MRRDPARGRRGSLVAGALVLALGVSGVARPAAAAAAAPATTTTASSASEAEAAAPTTVDDALERGDLSGARELATAAREADPTPENWRREAAAHGAAGDYEAAIAAWEGHRAALSPGDTAGRAAADAALAELEEASRGAVADEPPSTHREAFDAERAARLAALAPKTKPPPKEKVPRPKPPKERIIKKWYFWLTVAALAASAGAITGIAIQAAREDQVDDLSGRGLRGLRGGGGAGGAGPLGPGGFVLRF